MLSMHVTVEAEMVVRRSLTLCAAPPSSGAPSARTIAHIQLFAHALHPFQVVFGTALVDGQLTALPSEVVQSLTALYSRNARHIRPAPRPKFP